MADFIVSELDDTLINLKDKQGNKVGEVEAVDVIDCWVQSRKAENKEDWYIHFQSDFKKLTGVVLSKTSAVMIYQHACELVESLKKSGSKESEPTEQSDTVLSTPNET